MTGTHPNYSGYIQETAAAFYIALPNVFTGACPASTTPVYRLWNARVDSNHRYTTDPRHQGADAGDRVHRRRLWPQRSGHVRSCLAAGVA